MRICKLRGVNWAIIARLRQAVGYLVFPRVIKFGIGGGKTIDTDNVIDPVVGFIFGSKFTKLDKS